MSSRIAKDIRKQIRPIILEVAPQMLNDALCQVVFDRVVAALKPSLAILEKQLGEAMALMNKRQEEILAPLVARIAEGVAQQEDNNKPEVKNEQS